MHNRPQQSAVTPPRSLLVVLHGVGVASALLVGITAPAALGTAPAQEIPQLVATDLDLGEAMLKNIADPVRVFAISSGV